MEKRSVEISLDTAKEWYNGDNESLKQIVLQAFTEEELSKEHWKRITTVEAALDYLEENNIRKDLTKPFNELPVSFFSTYPGKVLVYQMVVAALTNNEERHLTTGYKWYPVVQFCRPEDKRNCCGDVLIGTIESEGEKYSVMGGNARDGAYAGLGIFDSTLGVSNSAAHIGFRSVSTKEIAEHISTYFGKLLFEVHYGGTNCNWQWIK